MTQPTDTLGAVVRCERRYYRVVPGGIVWLLNRDDRTAEHPMYPTGYDGRCSYCWLNQTHSEAAHTARVSA